MPKMCAEFFSQDVLCLNVIDGGTIALPEQERIWLEHCHLSGRSIPLTIRVNNYGVGAVWTVSTVS